MSQRKPQPRKTDNTRPSVATKKAPIAYVPPVETWGDAETDHKGRNLFWGIAAGMFVVMMILAMRVGVNGDDSFQVDYSNKLLAYYGSMGKDTSALNIPKGTMHLYGGFFDIIAGVSNKALGYTELQPAYHNVRHGLNVLFGWGAMVLTGLFVCLLAGWRGALIALIMMFLSPRFFGDSLMNPKDIPYAFGNILALYGMLRLLRNLPAFSWKDIAMVVLGMGIAEATRAGGILLFAYLGLFAGVHFLMRYGWGGLTNETGKVTRYAVVVFGCIVAAHIFAILFWPYALVSPIKHPLDALSNFSQLGIKIRLLFQGDNVMSDKTHWSYPLQWIFRTIPLSTLLGFFASIGLIVPLWKKYPRLGVFMGMFSVIFPLAYIIYKDSVLHDGWRHLTFVYPGMVVMASLVYVWLLDKFAENKPIQYAVYGVLALTMLEPAVFIARNSAFPYVYFNPINGGMKGAYGKFETDYWGLSVRQSVEWLEKEGKISPDMKDTVTIATHYLWNLERYVNERYKGKVKVAYMKYNRRYDYPWNYAIYPCRFISSGQLLSGNWPPKSNTLHTIKANNTPICAILEDKTGFAFAAEAAMKRNAIMEADSLYKLELKVHPDNDVALLGLANIAMSTQNLPAMKSYADQVLAINPEDPAALNFIGIEQLQKNDINGALETFRRNIELNDDNYLAYYWQAMALRANNNLSQASESLVKCLEMAPTFRNGYQLLAEIYNQMGDKGRAQQVLQVMQQNTGGPR